MKVDELIWRIKKEPEWYVLGALGCLLLIVASVFLYTRVFQPSTVAQQQFNNVFARYQQAMRTGEAEPVMEGFNRVVSEHPDSRVADKALFFLGKLHMEQENYLEAMRQFQQLRENYSDSFFREAALLNLSYCASERENYEQALSFLDELLEGSEESPLHKEALWQKAMVQAELGQNDDALQSLDRLTESVGEDDAYWSERAQQFRTLLTS